MVEKGIKGGKCHAMHRYAKASNKYIKNYNKNKESLYNQYLDANNLYGREMSQKLPVDGFEWVEDILIINEKLYKIYKTHKKTMMKKTIKNIFLK